MRRAWHGPKWTWSACIAELSQRAVSLLTTLWKSWQAAAQPRSRDAGFSPCFSLPVGDVPSSEQGCRGLRMSSAGTVVFVLFCPWRKIALMGEKKKQQHSRKLVLGVWEKSQDWNRTESAGKSCYLQFSQWGEVVRVELEQINGTVSKSLEVRRPLPG